MADKIPTGIRRFLETLHEYSIIDGPAGLIGYHCTSPADKDPYWRVVMYPTPLETVGGAQDGAIAHPHMSVDLVRTMGLFSEVHALRWESSIDDLLSDFEVLPAGPCFVMIGKIGKSGRKLPVVLALTGVSPVDAVIRVKVDKDGRPIEKL